jgi:3-hydroxyacyl-[acyl-carrier-protein] dehydratase
MHLWLILGELVIRLSRKPELQRFSVLGYDSASWSLIGNQKRAIGFTSERRREIVESKTMRFRQIDRIVELEPGKKIVATRLLSGQEDYLRDHFPLFPVMPGVLMLEAAFQTASWLVRATEEFANTTCVLKEIRNAKFADFVQPGQILEVHAEIQKVDGNLYTIKVSGQKGEVTSFSARLLIETQNLQDIDSSMGNLNNFTKACMQGQLAELMAD